MTSNIYVVLVGMDYSEAAGLALTRALELVKKAPERSEVHVVNVVPTPHPDPNRAMGEFSTPEQASALRHGMAKLQNAVDEQLASAVADRSMAPGALAVPVFSHVRMVDEPAMGIVQLAIDLGASLIIVGSCSESGLGRLFLGSVAEATVRDAYCEVLVVPAPDSRDEGKYTPPCPDCLAARTAAPRQVLWCAKHAHDTGHRLSYQHQAAQDGLAPLEV